MQYLLDIDNTWSHMDLLPCMPTSGCKCGKRKCYSILTQLGWNQIHLSVQSQMKYSEVCGWSSRGLNSFETNQCFQIQIHFFKIQVLANFQFSLNVWIAFPQQNDTKSTSNIFGCIFLSLGWKQCISVFFLFVFVTFNRCQHLIEKNVSILCFSKCILFFFILKPKIEINVSSLKMTSNL